MANVLINNQDTYINRSFIVSVTKKSESDIFRIKMSNNDIYELESVSYKYFKNDKIKFDEPFDLSRYEKMGGRPYFLEKNKFIPYIPISEGGTGEQGEPGDSAYQIWLNQGNTGTEEDFLNSLEGAPGDIGPIGPQGIPGEPGTPGEKGDIGPIGPQGIQGEPGTPGKDGAQGVKGDTGISGEDGQSAYQIAVKNGFIGSESEWIDSLSTITNIKDNSVLKVWVGSSEEFLGITMEDGIIYHVYNNEGICETKVKAPAISNVITEPTLISDIFSDEEVANYMKVKLSVPSDNMVTQDMLDSVTNFGGKEGDLINDSPSDLVGNNPITSLDGVKYLRNIKSINLNGVLYSSNDYIADFSLNTKVESIENSFSNSNIGGVKLYGIKTINVTEV